MNRVRSVIIFLLAIFLSACSNQVTPPVALPHTSRWGIYTLNLITQEVDLLYGSTEEITNLDYHPLKRTIVFSQKVGGEKLENSEIFTIGSGKTEPLRLTDNKILDTYPAWSPDGSSIAYLSFPGETLDLFKMNADGSHVKKIYDSGTHDADIDWVADWIAFTRNSQIWLMHEDGTDAHPLTNPPRSGEWGDANLPFGDYDPRISPDGTRVVFERLVNDQSPHGNYDLFMVNIDGKNLTRLTETGYSQGLASWSPSGKQLAYILSAMGEVGLYDLYLINSDGSKNRNITPAAFPPGFLIRWVTFSEKETLLFFIGEWWS